MFAYCGNNPVNCSDPSGNVPISDFAYSAHSGIGRLKIKYDVPLYSQGKLKLCWAYCQLMIEDYHTGTTRTRTEADARAKEIAMAFHIALGKGCGKPTVEKQFWNAGATPENAGDGSLPKGLLSLYLMLENGPIYAYYWNGIPGSGAHMVVVTGVDVTSGLVYSNNPWGYSRAQTYSAFLNGVTGTYTDNMPLNSVMPLK